MKSTWCLFLFSEETKGECSGIDTSSVCQASYTSSSLPWSDTKCKKPVESDNLVENEEETTSPENSDSSPEDVAQGFMFQY